MTRFAWIASVATTLWAVVGPLSAQQIVQHDRAAGGTLLPVRPDGWIAGGGRPTLGTFEVGAFGQYTRFDENAGCPCDRPLNAPGFGGRVGLFLGPALALEVDAGTAQAERAIVGGDIRYTAVAARLNYNVFGVLGARGSVLAGVGAVRTSYDPDDTDRIQPPHEHKVEWGASGLAGARLALTDRVAVRIDGVADYMPSPESLNLTGRAGLTLLLGRLASRAAEAQVTTLPPRSPPPAQPPAGAIVTPQPAPPPPVEMCRTPGRTGIPASDPACTAPVETFNTTPIYFAFDRSDLTPEAEATLRAKLPWLQANQGARIRLEGHTDERGPDAYNVALGMRRANAAREWLVRNGIAAGRVETATLGETRPVCEQRDEACWNRERRVEFVLVMGER